ncbi:MAG TPA: hypothetical protein VLB84_01045 [Bacteroidia bacterium]|nr:hypothetical protein [Bacteroidia bacterium]
MNYEAAILYVFQRMRELGKTPDQYHFEPVRIIRSYADLYGGKVIIPAYNELYILINPEIYANLMIIADNTVFSTSSSKARGVQEFTGLIKIQSLPSDTPPGGGGTPAIAAFAASATSASGGGTTPTGNFAVDFLRVVY